MGTDEIDLATLETAVAQAAVRYDRQGDQHYDVASALIKSIRGSDVDAALHYLARMVEAGEDPRFIARRLVISASEDIGMADPTALLTAVAAADAVAFIGMPEGHFPLAQAVVHLATAPKSNAVTDGHGRVRRRRPRRAGRAGAARACATRTTPARRSSATARPTSTRTPTPTASSRSSTRPTRWSARTTTGPPAGAPRRGSANGWPSCGRSSAARADAARRCGTDADAARDYCDRRRAVSTRSSRTTDDREQEHACPQERSPG